MTQTAQSGTNPDRNVSVTATATCSTGTRVGGGGEVTDTDPQADRYAAMIASKPVNPASWAVTGYTVIPLVGVMTVTAWALCAP